MDYLQGLPLSKRSHRQAPHSCFLYLNVQEKQPSCHHVKACKAAFLHFHWKDEIPQVSRILEEEMKGAANLAVELEVDMHQGNNWYEAK